MVDIEKLFVNQVHNCYIQFALEIEHPKHMPSILEKMKNAISGIYIKSDGSKFYDNRKDLQCKDLSTDLLKDEFGEFLQNKEKYMKRLPSYK